MPATITQYLDNIIRNAQEITTSRDATDDIADAAAAIIADVADLREHYNIEPLKQDVPKISVNRNRDAETWMQRAIVAEQSADDLALELRKLTDLVMNSYAVNKQHQEYAAFSMRIASISATLVNYEKGRPK